MTQTNEQTGLAPVQRVEEGKATVAANQRQIKVAPSAGGLTFNNMEEVVNFGKIMAAAACAVPKHLRENIGACVAVCIQAVEWKMSPFAVANKSYVVNDRLSFESQLIHAVVEQRAPLEGRLRCSYSGEGLTRKCKVVGRIKGEKEPFEYESPEFQKILPKNSPLWNTKPDLQLFYNTSRDWARMYFPDVILGVYAEDELERVTEAAGTPIADAIRALPHPTEAVNESVNPPAAPETHPASEPKATEEAAPAAPSTDSARIGQPPAAAGGPTEPGTDPDPNEMPNPAPLAWITAWAIRHRPEHVSLEEAEEVVVKFLKISLPKPWEKLTRSMQESKFKEWLNLGFGPWAVKE